MEIIASATIWVLFACFLVFPLLGLPPAMHRTAMTLLVAELVALGFWSYGSAGCEQRPCSTAAEAGRTAAMVDVPLLSVALVALALYSGLRGAAALRAPAGGGRRSRAASAARAASAGLSRHDRTYRIAGPRSPRRRGRRGHRP